MSSIRTTCPYCGVGCGVSAERSSGGLVTLGGDLAHPANFGRLCSKGMKLGETLGARGRLLYPQVAGQRTAWDRALDHAARGLSGVIAEHGPDAVAFYVSGQLLTEDYYVANKLAKGFIGTANIDANSRLCMASAVAGYKRAFGSDTVPTSYEDLETADLVVLVGSNAAWCHPVLFQRILAARRADPNKRLVVLDPRRTTSAEEADLHLAIEPGTDAIVMAGLLDHLRRVDRLDFGFLEASTEGFAATLAAARALAPSLAEVAQRCGVPQADLARFYDWFAQTPQTVTAYSMGVNQSVDGSDNVSAIINCHLATGRVGKPGCGPFSLTGQPNAMGGREVGALANLLAAHLELGNDGHTDLLGRFWGSERVVRRPGRKAVDMFRAVESGEIRAIWIMATNPVVSMPDALRVRRALEACPHVIVSEAFSSADTLDYADVVFPAQPWGEKDGTVTNSERRISRARAFAPPTAEARPDWWIVSAVARRMGYSGFDFASSAEVFDEHARLSAFENPGMSAGGRVFDLGGLVGMTRQQYDELQPVQWPVPASVGASGSQGSDGVSPFSEGRFSTTSGRARLVPVERVTTRSGTEHHPLRLNTGRVRDHWHTMTRTARSPSLSAHSAEPFGEVHPETAEALGVAHDELIEVTSPRGRVIVRAAVTTWQRPGSIFVPMHWSRDQASDGCVNDLVHDAVCPTSGQPDLKGTAVRVRPYPVAWQGFILSRRPLAVDAPPFEHWVRVRGHGHWRYEIAGVRPLEDPAVWARDLLCSGESDPQWAEYRDDRRGRYRGVRMIGDDMDSCVFVGPDLRLPSRDWLGRQFEAVNGARADRNSLLAGRPGTGVTADGALICACNGVSMGTLVDGIHRLGLRTCEAVSEATGAGTGCGSCLTEIRALLRGVTSEGPSPRATSR